MNVQEEIPESLRAEVGAALDWYNQEQGSSFEVTGILDPDEAVGSSGPTGLQLILCQGDRCEQQSFQVTAQGEGYDVCLLASDPDPRSGSSLLPELDPPPGPRRGWLDRELPKHAFTVLLFYRGFW
ncbi:MAG: hypothetical protein CMN75_06505 [Spirochaeta sp.]|nr:hypothetical protein [Spirochaeta sp.]RPG14578.1 MAG: hypothetical protein CBC32_000220 [Proteobacteria bacterium TMED72]